MPIFPTITTIFTALKKHLTLALFILSLAASALFIYSWLDARRAAAQLAATLAAQQKIIASATAAQSARDAALTQSLAEIAALERQVQSPQQASAALAQSLPQFIASSSTSPSGSSSGASSLPVPLQFIPFPPAISSAPANSSQQGSLSSGKSPAGQSSSAPQSQSSAPTQNVVILSPPSAKDPAAPPTTSATTTGSTAASSLPSTDSQSQPIPAPAGFLSLLKSEISKMNLLSPDAKNPSAPSTPTTQPGQLAAHGNPSSAPPSAADKCSPGSPNPGASTACPPSPNSSTQQGPPSGASAPQGTAVVPTPGSICIPPPDLKPLYDSIENCEACAAKLTASQADLSDETAKFNAASAQRDSALKAVHGTFWSRTRTAAKWIAIGAAAGAIIAKYH